MLSFDTMSAGSEHYIYKALKVIYLHITVRGHLDASINQWMVQLDWIKNVTYKEHRS